MKVNLVQLFMGLVLCSPIIAETKRLDNKYIPADYVVRAQTIRADMGQKLSKKHNMEVIGTLGGLADCVNVLGLDFEIYGPLSKEKLREILIDCVEEFLTVINSDEKLRPKLKNYPFTEREIDIGIFVVDNNRRKIFDPDIAVAAARRGELIYKTNDKNDRYKYKSEFVESYEDALNIVKSQK